MSRIYVCNSHYNSQAAKFLTFIENELPEVDFDSPPEDKDWSIDFQIRPYTNCREQGFVLSARQLSGGKATPVHHFVWYEHRNSDSLCVIYWEDKVSPYAADSLTAADIPEEVFPDKYSYTKSFKWGDFGSAWSWFREQLSAIDFNEIPLDK